jgi:hypothetical protein
MEDAETPRIQQSVESRVMGQQGTPEGCWTGAAEKREGGSVWEVYSFRFRASPSDLFFAVGMRATTPFPSSMTNS